MRNYEHIEFLLNELMYKGGEFYRNGKVVKQSKSGKGLYYRVQVRKGESRYGAFVHNLVFAYHHGISELKKHETIDHINGDKYDNRIENLQGLSRFENSQKDSGGKLSMGDAKMIKTLLKEDFSVASIAKRFDVSETTIRKIKNGTRFRYIEV
jgi:hypothetical protein